MTWRKKKPKPGHVGQHQHMTRVKQLPSAVDRENEDYLDVSVGEQLDVLKDLGDGTLYVRIRGEKGIVPAVVIAEPQAAWKSRHKQSASRRNSLEDGIDIDIFERFAQSHADKKGVVENWGFGAKHGDEEA